MSDDVNERFDRVTRINRHLIRNIDSEVMPLTLYRIEADLGLTQRRESPDVGKPMTPVFKSRRTQA